MNFTITLSWQVSLIICLWVGGGLGWLWGFEASRKQSLKVFGKLLIVLLWPGLATVAMLDSLYAEVKRFVLAVWSFLRS